MLSSVLAAERLRVADDRLPRARARDRARCRHLRGAARRPVRRRSSKRWITATLSGFVLLGALLPIVTLGVIGDDVRSMFDGRYVVDDFSLVLKALFLLAGYVVVLMSHARDRRGRLPPGRVLRAAAQQHPGHGDDGVSARSGQRLRRPRVPVDPGVHAGRLAQARPQEQRGGRQVLPARRVRQRRDAVRHEPAVRRDRHDHARPSIGDSHRRRASSVASRCWASCSSSSASRSRSARCRSTRGRPTPTRAPRRPSPRSSVVGSKAAGFVALVTLVYVAFPHGRRRVPAVHLGDGGADDDVRQRGGAAPDATSCACSPTPASARAGSS